MKVEIDTKVLLDFKINANQLILLNIIYNRDKELFSKFYQEIKNKEEIKYLLNNGFITCVKPSVESLSIDDMLLSPKSMSILSRRNKSIIRRSVSVWIDEYRSLFPKGLNKNNHPYRGNKQGCIKKMTDLLYNHPDFDKSLILKVTKKYVSNKARVNYDFMSEAHYFIEKNGSSPMEGLCEAYLSEENNEANHSERNIFLI